eukprot:31124-Pelagococcus_subviridis.AAC.2
MVPVLTIDPRGNPHAAASASTPTAVSELPHVPSSSRSADAASTASSAGPRGGAVATVHLTSNVMSSGGSTPPG